MDVTEVSSYLFLFAAAYGLASFLWQLTSCARKAFKRLCSHPRGAHLSSTNQAEGSQENARTMLATATGNPERAQQPACKKIIVTKNRIAHFDDVQCGPLATANRDDCTSYQFCEKCKKQCKKFL